jgi:hypothetical protein
VHALEINSGDKPNRALLYAALILVIFMALFVRASYVNTSKFYLRVSEGAVEVRQGTFSPGGKNA